MSIGSTSQSQPLYTRTSQNRVCQFRSAESKANTPACKDLSSSFNLLIGLYKIKGKYYCETALQDHEAGDYPKARQNYEKALKFYSKAYGTEHPYVGTILYNLGDLHQALKHYDQAESYYLRANQLEEKIYGPAHPKTIQTLQNLASLYGERGQYARAIPIYQKILKIQKESFPENVSEIATTEGDLASIYHDFGNIIEARKLYKSAIAYLKLVGNTMEQKRIEKNLSQLENKENSQKC